MESPSLMNDDRTSPNADTGKTIKLTPTEILARVQSGRRVIQDFLPLPESLETELSRQFFQDRGSLAFIGNPVPFEINNNGNHSMRAVSVFFANLVEAESTGTLETDVYVLELGIGSGLFARYFLDHFRTLCNQHGKDFYGRLHYLATDISERMVADVERLGTLAGHRDRYRVAKLDALRLADDLRPLLWESDTGPRRVRAVFVNYLLDNLPMTALRFDDDGPKQLYVRTCLARDIDYDEYGLSADEIATRAASDDPAVRSELVDLYPLFALEYAYRPIALDEIPFSDFALEYDRGSSPYLLFNYGPLQCLHSLRDFLADGGMVMINDYGQIRPDQSKEENVHQRFSGSIACEINFPLISQFCERRCDWQWIAPETDSDQIYTRLTGRNVPQSAQQVFVSLFGKKAQEADQAYIQEARRLRQDGRIEQALTSYERAMATQPYNWSLADEVVRFLMTDLKNYDAAMQMSQHALSLNESFSANLWCNLGDCRKALRQRGVAECYQRALQIDPDNARAHFGLGLVAASRRDYGAALSGFANALTRDKDNNYRDRILQEQREVLERLQHRWEWERRNLANRVNRVIELDAIETEESAKDEGVQSQQ
jgi:Tfp pilus assembly protein PilF